MKKFFFHIFAFVIVFCFITTIFKISSLHARPAEVPTIILKGIGSMQLIQSTSQSGTKASQLVLTRPGGRRQVIDSFYGLQPSKLRRFDLDSDEQAEIIATLMHPDGTDVMPYIYSTKENFTRIYPPQKQQMLPDIICRKIILTSRNNHPAICAKFKVSFHDFGPPDLYRLEFYKLENQNLELMDKGFTHDSHFNVLMNRAAFAYYQGSYQEAVDYYNKAVSSSTGRLTNEAFIEAIFGLAQAEKFNKNFDEALKLFQKIVLEFKQNERTNEAQQEIEFISANINNKEELSFLIDVLSLTQQNKWHEALELLNQHPFSNKTFSLQDRFLFIRGEILIALNRIEKAIEAFSTIKQKFPDSQLIEDADTMLNDLQGSIDGTNGL
ncbi:MAG: tetratricopeptide repeat protein [Candidatus Rifleibacteriota bacterium]